MMSTLCASSVVAVFRDFYCSCVTASYCSSCPKGSNFFFLSSSLFLRHSFMRDSLSDKRAIAKYVLHIVSSNQSRRNFALCDIDVHVYFLCSSRCIFQSVKSKSENEKSGERVRIRASASERKTPRGLCPKTEQICFFRREFEGDI